MTFPFIELLQLRCELQIRSTVKRGAREYGRLLRFRRKDTGTDFESAVGLILTRTFAKRNSTLIDNHVWCVSVVCFAGINDLNKKQFVDGTLREINKSEIKIGT